MTFYVDVFCPLSLPTLLPDLTVYTSNTADPLLLPKLLPDLTVYTSNTAGVI
jgi:hypothetical protein